MKQQRAIREGTEVTAHERAEAGIYPCGCAIHVFGDSPKCWCDFAKTCSRCSTRPVPTSCCAVTFLRGWHATK